MIFVFYKSIYGKSSILLAEAVTVSIIEMFLPSLLMVVWFKRAVLSLIIVIPVALILF
ncbi:MAG TPA: hypothetical protein H9891_06495 [Candidatus Salinicoccus stercoripullorum]|uniref:Uncharacterized protein n=1 Tax=Candidatus Salinicoccus stercoripullorum TaxID=2838756 RepID=A0A9D1QIF0_9STAP|nr:hypothetical protein [Candidatus Salinicoccus stercoripullorum]